MPGDPAPEYAGNDLEAMAAAGNYHRWIVDEFSPYLGGTTAEVGAGVGSVSRLLLGHVNHLLAFEPSEKMFLRLSEELRDERGATAIPGCFAPGYAPEGIDSIVYINVLEHIEDDRGELARAFEALKPGGHLLILVPALEWLFSDLDREVGHFRRYTKKGLASLVADAGFTVLKARYFDFPGVIPWWINFVVLRNTIGSGSVGLYDRLVVPVARMVEGLVPPPIGKNVLLVGRRPDLGTAPCPS